MYTKRKRDSDDVGQPPIKRARWEAAAADVPREDVPDSPAVSPLKRTRDEGDSPCFQSCKKPRVSTSTTSTPTVSEWQGAYNELYEEAGATVRYSPSNQILFLLWEERSSRARYDPMLL